MLPSYDTKMAPTWTAARSSGRPHQLRWSKANLGVWPGMVWSYKVLQTSSQLAKPVGQTRFKHVQTVLVQWAASVASQSSSLPSSWLPLCNRRFSHLMPRKSWRHSQKSWFQMFPWYFQRFQRDEGSWTSWTVGTQPAPSCMPSACAKVLTLVHMNCYFWSFCVCFWLWVMGFVGSRGGICVSSHPRKPQVVLTHAQGLPKIPKHSVAWQEACWWVPMASWLWTTILI